MKYLSILLLAFLVFSCNTENKTDDVPEGNETETGDVQEELQKEFTTIADMEFSTKNLDELNYRNGDKIPLATSREEWKAYDKKQEGCAAYPNFDKKNKDKYGIVYSGYAIADTRGLAPEGYRIPTREDWDKIVNELGGREFAGQQLKADKGWPENGDNKSGFNAYPGGYYADGWNGMDTLIYYWSSTPVDEEMEYHYHFDIFGSDNSVDEWYDYDGWGLYVRLIKE